MDTLLDQGLGEPMLQGSRLTMVLVPVVGGLEALRSAVLGRLCSKAVPEATSP